MRDIITAFILANVIFWLGYFIGEYRSKANVVRLMDREIQKARNSLQVAKDHAMIAKALIDEIDEQLEKAKEKEKLSKN